MEDNKKSIFDGLLTPNAIDNCRQKIYDPYAANKNLRVEVDNAKLGLKELITAINEVKKVSDISPETDYLENYKEKFDTVAYLLDEFIAEFKPIYEVISNRYIAEKLSGTFDRDENEDELDSEKIYSSSPKGAIGWQYNKKQ